MLLWGKFSTSSVELIKKFRHIKQITEILNLFGISEKFYLYVCVLRQSVRNLKTKNEVFFFNQNKRAVGDVFLVYVIVYCVKINSCADLSSVSWITRIDWDGHPIYN